MAERLVPLLATQVARIRVRFLVPARDTFRVEKVSLFCNPVSGGMFSSTAIEIIFGLKKIADSKLNKLPELRLSSHGFYSYLVRFSAVLTNLMIGQGLYFDLLLETTKKS
jgi:hypothetical protein